MSERAYGFLGLRFFVVAEPDIRVATLALIRPLKPLVRLTETRNFSPNNQQFRLTVPKFRQKSIL